MHRIYAIRNLYASYKIQLCHYRVMKKDISLSYYELFYYLHQILFRLLKKQYGNLLNRFQVFQIDVYFTYLSALLLKKLILNDSKSLHGTQFDEKYD